MMVLRVAIVTGASQGIGRATAIRPARDFPTVVLVARGQSALDDAATAARCTSADITVFALDLRQRESADTVIHRTLG